MHFSTALISSAHASARMVHLTIDHNACLGLLDVSIHPQTVYARTCTCRHLHYRIHEYLDDQNLLTCFYSQVSHLHLPPVIRRGHPRSLVEAEELLDDQQHG